MTGGITHHRVVELATTLQERIEDSSGKPAMTRFIAYYIISNPNNNLDNTIDYAEEGIGAANSLPSAGDVVYADRGSQTESGQLQTGTWLGGIDLLAGSTLTVDAFQDYYDYTSISFPYPVTPLLDSGNWSPTTIEAGATLIATTLKALTVKVYGTLNATTFTNDTGSGETQSGIFTGVDNFSNASISVFAGGAATIGTTTAGTFSATVSGTLTSTGDLDLGAAGHVGGGALTVNAGGKAFIEGSIGIGRNSGDIGFVIINSTGQLIYSGSTIFTVGDSGKGSLALNSDADEQLPNLTAGNQQGAEGDLTITGTGVGTTTTTLTVDGNTILGNSGSSGTNGASTVTAGGDLGFKGTLTFGATETGSGSLVVDGLGSQLNAVSTAPFTDGPSPVATVVGAAGSGSLTIRNDATADLSDVFVANQPGSVGTLTVGDHANVTVTFLGIGFAGDLPTDSSLPLPAGPGGGGNLLIENDAALTVVDSGLAVDGTGQVSIESGGSLIARSTLFDPVDYLGVSDGCNVGFTVTGSGSFFHASELWVGSFSGTTAALNVMDRGQVVMDQALDVGMDGGVGSVTVSGANSSLKAASLADTTTIGAGGSLSATDGGIIDVICQDYPSAPGIAGETTGGFHISATAGGVIEVTPLTKLNAGSLSPDAPAIASGVEVSTGQIAGFGSITGDEIFLTQSGSIVAENGLLQISGIVNADGGQFYIDSNGALELEDACNAPVTFSGAGTLKLNSLTTFQGPSNGEPGKIGGFQSGDTIDMASLIYKSSYFASWNATSNILSIEDSANSDNVVATFAFTNGNYTNFNFSIHKDGSNDTSLSYVALAAVLLNDNPLAVTVDGTATLTSSLLSVSDPNYTDSQLTYTVVTAPSDGTLLKNGSATSSFTQADIDNGLIAYHETASNVSSDSFTFNVSDPAGNHTANTQFQFQISQPDVAISALPNLSGFSTLGTGDFNDDGFSSIVLQNKSNGQMEIWYMGNGHIIGDYPYGNLSGYAMLGSGDFNGDGTSDIVWQNISTGQAEIWSMQNGAVIADTPIGNLSGYNLIGTGDFTGSGTSDMVWQNRSTGQAEIWIMSSNHLASDIPIGNLGGYNLIGTADLNGDHQTDLIWQNASTGAVDVWFMGNGHLVADYSYGNLGGYKLLATGDINQDGTTALLWQNKSTGEVSDWNISPQTGLPNGVFQSFGIRL